MKMGRLGVGLKSCSKRLWSNDNSNDTDDSNSIERGVHSHLAVPEICVVKMGC